jgi:hypothetical protein
MHTNCRRSIGADAKLSVVGDASHAAAVLVNLLEEDRGYLMQAEAEALPRFYGRNY